MLGLLHDAREPERRAGAARGVIWLAPLAAVAMALVSTLGFFLALGGGDFGCLVGGGAAGPVPSRAAVAEIPPARLVIYQRAGKRFRIDWAFLASIGAQECSHGPCRGENGSGCAGPMQIAVRRASPCSPGSGPTLWDRFKSDGDGDGRTDVNDPADAVFTAARLLRHEKGAPPIGGSYAQYRQAACRYYGACADATVTYADQVMARAVQYGFSGAGTPSDGVPASVQPVAAPILEPAASSCGEGQLPIRGERLGPVIKLHGPRRLAPLPAFAAAPGFGALGCDARIVRDVVGLVRRYGVLVTACYAIHSLAGEHPLGAAVDLVPAGGDWTRTLRLARDLGWQAGCAPAGLAPACAKPPFRFIGYNGFPGHGDPVGCLCQTPHLHLSWQTSASAGQPENQPRTSYFPASWITVFAPDRQAAGHA
jgi:hypothetical protein